MSNVPVIWGNTKNIFGKLALISSNKFNSSKITFENAVVFSDRA